jgi:cell division protein FtsI/penicillin-binding protein 2
VSDISNELKKSFKVFFRAINKEYEHEFARLMIEAIKSGDFQTCVNAPRGSFVDNNGNIRIESNYAFGLTYIPFRRVNELKQQLAERDELILELEKVREFYGDKSNWHYCNQENISFIVSIDEQDEVRDKYRYALGGKLARTPLKNQALLDEIKEKV